MPRNDVSPGSLPPNPPPDDLAAQTAPRKRFAPSHPRLAASIAGVFLLVIGVAGLELACYVLNRIHPTYKLTTVDRHCSQGEYYTYDTPYGYALLPNNKVDYVAHYENKVAFSVVYNSDEKGLKTTPVDHRDGRTRFAIFFGCSLTYGEGVNDDQTLPCYFGRYAPTYMPYNFAVGGYGPQQMLLRLQRNEVRPLVDESEGVAVYVFIQHHINRAIGAMRVSNMWAKRFPYYDFQDGRLQYFGNFEDNRPFRTPLYRLLFHSNIVTYFAIDFPPRIGGRQLDLTAAILDEARKEFLKTFPTSRFYVLLYPGFNADYGTRILPYLDKRGVPYLDHPNLFDGAPWPLKLPDERHPTPQAHETLARQLVQDLSAPNAQ